MCVCVRARAIGFLFIWFNEITETLFTQQPTWYSDLATNIILIARFAGFPHSLLKFITSISEEVFVKFSAVSPGPQTMLGMY